jgi:NAD(P)-dependent dehydrogenase (short-subunit alcohol dehydrogenase family)
MSLQINLAGKIALVTGASLGIGRGCAEQLALAGAHVVINGRNPDDGQRTTAAIIAAGGSAEFLRGDMSQLDDIRAVFDSISARHGKLDILVNNAGFNLFKGVQDTTPEEFDTLINLDLRGLFFITQAAVPLMKFAGGGTIVNIASVHATSTIGNIAAYAAAKGGVVALTRSLCQELGPFGIRVNTISPGFVETPLMDRWLASEPDAQATMQRVNSLHPAGRIGNPAEIGAFVVFLASEYGGFIAGANLLQDGGLTARLMH